MGIIIVKWETLLAFVTVIELLYKTNTCLLPLQYELIMSGSHIYTRGWLLPWI